MKLNVLKLSHLARPHTHEGARAVAISPELAAPECAGVHALGE
jgi:60 kDa SS-A/Ro ribonucleoprotein